MDFCKRLKQRRHDLCISADELGKMIGKNRATIYRYEKGDIESVPTDILEPLATALETTPTWLMGWDKEEFSSELTFTPEVLCKHFKLTKEEHNKMIEYMNFLKYIRNDKGGDALSHKRNKTNIGG